MAQGALGRRKALIAADLGQAVPSSSTTTRFGTGRTGFGGAAATGFGGAGTPPR